MGSRVIRGSRKVGFLNHFLDSCFWRVLRFPQHNVFQYRHTRSSWSCSLTGSPTREFTPVNRSYRVPYHRIRGVHRLVHRLAIDLPLLV